MAKGLRSKSKRKNRSILRAVLSEPINRKRQEILATDLQNDLAAKNGSSITSLKDVLSSRSSAKSEQEVLSHLDGDADNDDEIDEEEDVRNLLVSEKTKTSKKVRTAVHKASKNMKHKKTLEWF
jgi:plasmid stability protein